jgi:single-strand DNA-binding protein
LAETCKQYLVKGSHVYVDGRLQTRSWNDPEGKRHSRTELVANEMIILDNRSNRSHSDEQQTTTPAEQQPPEPDDEFPF